MRDTPANHKRGKNPVCIVFDYSRTLTQKEFPVGLRSWLMRESGGGCIIHAGGGGGFTH